MKAKNKVRVGDVVVDKGYNGDIGLITKFKNGPVPTWYIKIDSSKELLKIADEDMSSEFEIIDHLEETIVK